MKSISAFWEKGWRDYQEDFYGYGYLDKKWIFVVSDGMGGHQAGDIASKLTVAYILEFWNKHLCTESNIRNCIEKSIALVYQKFQEKLHNVESGCTVVYAIWDASKHKLVYSWLGDSRLYLVLPPENQQNIEIASFATEYKGWRLYALTADHSLVWEHYENNEISYDELKNHPYKNRLARSLHSNMEKQEIDDIPIREIALEKPAGYLFICTDGVWESLGSSEELLKMFIENVEPEKINKAVKNEVDKWQDMIESGDNYTGIIVNLEQLPHPEKEFHILANQEQSQKKKVTTASKTHIKKDWNKSMNPKKHSSFSKRRVNYILLIWGIIIGVLVGIIISQFVITKIMAKKVSSIQNVTPEHTQLNIAEYFKQISSKRIDSREQINAIIGTQAYLIVSKRPDFKYAKGYIINIRPPKSPTQKKEVTPDKPLPQKSNKNNRNNKKKKPGNYLKQENKNRPDSLENKGRTKIEDAFMDDNIKNIPIGDTTKSGR